MQLDLERKLRTLLTKEKEKAEEEAGAVYGPLHRRLHILTMTLKYARAVTSHAVSQPSCCLKML